MPGGNLWKYVFGVAAPPYGLSSIPFIAQGGLAGNPSDWGFVLRFLKSSERACRRTPIVVSIPLRPRMSS